jgi:hypothetical protein
MGIWLDPLRSLLDAADRPVEFFFRDDDVGKCDERLWLLLDVFHDRALPVDLALIPTKVARSNTEELYARAMSVPGKIAWHQHGFAHVNHEPAGRKFEFGPSRSRALQRRDIAEGQRRLRELLGSVAPVFTPPWNRCTATTGECLLELGFELLSRESRAVPLATPGLSELSVRVDWDHQKRCGLTRAEFGEMLAQAAMAPGPVGIMFHHAEMDEQERAAAGDMLGLLAGHPHVRSRLMMELVDGDARIKRSASGHSSS